MFLRQEKVGRGGGIYIDRGCVINDMVMMIHTLLLGILPAHAGIVFL